MKKGLGIIGIGLMVGVSVYVLLNIRNKSKDSTANISKKDYTDNSWDNKVSNVVPNNNHNDNAEFNKTKSSTINTMSVRHKEASKIMKDSVETIYKRSEISEDENHELENISDELDDLLGEE